MIGPNGSGKSTLLRAVYRMLRPAAGRITLDGNDVWRLSPLQSAQRTGVVVQEMPTDFEFTVAEVVQMGRTPHRRLLVRDQTGDAQVVAESLRQVNMLEFGDRPYTTLSGGEKQRVLVARALAQQPRLLVLDEPTNHLDNRFQIEILDLVRRVGITSIVTIHDLNLAATYCDRLYLLYEGQIVASGTPGEVLTPERIRQVFGVTVIVGEHPPTAAPSCSSSTSPPPSDHTAALPRDRPPITRSLGAASRSWDLRARLGRKQPR